MVVVGYDEAELLDIACVTTSLITANRLGASPAYTVLVASPGGRAITCDSGVTLLSQRSLERLTGPLDTLIVSGGFGHLAAADNARIVGHIRRLSKESRRVASVCTGATVLAAAGLFNGKHATTHWRFARLLASTYPQVNVDPDPIYIRDGSVLLACSRNTWDNHRVGSSGMRAPKRQPISSPPLHYRCQVWPRDAASGPLKRSARPSSAVTGYRHPATGQPKAAQARARGRIPEPDDLGCGHNRDRRSRRGPSLRSCPACRS